MATRRMLHNKISLSIQVNRLPLKARLLFTWMISHADDEGRLKGNPSYVRAKVLPMTQWADEEIKKYLVKMREEGLIHYWQVEDDWFIEFVKWEDHQTLRKDRFNPSNLPSFEKKKTEEKKQEKRNGKQNDNQMATKCQPSDNQRETQANIDKHRLTKANANKDKANGKESRIANKNSCKSVGEIIDPANYRPNNAKQTAALEAWKKLEPNNPEAFMTTYLNACKRGLPTDLFYKFCSEIEQDKTINNKGAVFNQKVKDYFEKNANN